MTEEELRRLATVQANRNYLLRAMEKPFVTVEAEEDWRFGCKNEPYRLRMMTALDRARRTAEARMREAAEDIIEQFNAELRAAGIEPDAQKDSA